MSKPGWWDVHRMLHKGHRGPDVSELQRLLVQDSGDRIPISGLFGDETEKAVKAFQQRNDLADDGLVGPVTFSILAEGIYRFQLPNPKLIRQESFTCWAAALDVHSAGRRSNIRVISQWVVGIRVSAALRR